MSDEYREIIKRLARVAELLERKEHALQELKEDMAHLHAEAIALRKELLTLHIDGDSEDV